MRNDTPFTAKELADWKAVAGTPSGLRVLHSLLKKTNLFGVSYAPGDALATAHNEGMRRIGAAIIAALGFADPEKLKELLIMGDDDESGN